MQTAHFLHFSYISSLLWRGHTVFWAHSTLINTCSIRGSSLETHGRPALFFSMISGEDVWYVALCVRSDPPSSCTTEILTWKRFSWPSRAERRGFSSPLQQGDGVLLGKNKTAKNWTAFLEKKRWTEKTVSSDASSCQSEAPVKSFTRSVHAARRFTWRSHPSCNIPHSHPAGGTTRWWGQLVTPATSLHRKSPTISYPSWRLMVGLLTLSWWSQDLRQIKLFFFALPHSTWNLSSPTRDWTHATPLQSKHRVLTTRLPGKTPVKLLWTQVSLGSHL